MSWLDELFKFGEKSADAQGAASIVKPQAPAISLQSAIQEQAQRAALANAVAQQPIAPQGFVPTSGQQVVAQGPGGLIQGQATDALPGATMPIAQANKEYAAAKKGNTTGGTEKKAPKEGNEGGLANFFQSIGYGLIDKPLNRDANTWDYLGKTIGQIGRLTEGSGLSAGTPIYSQERTLTPQQNNNLQVQIANAPKIIAAYNDNPSAPVFKGIKDVEQLKLQLLNKMVAQLGVNGLKYTPQLKSLLGIKSSSIDDLGAIVKEKLEAK
jgi:hypothetical protein